MSNFLEELKIYFENTPQETIFKDWAKYNTEENNVGPTMEEFLRYCHLYQLQSSDPLSGYAQHFSQCNPSLKFSSGFFYLKSHILNGKSNFCIS